MNIPSRRKLGAIALILAGIAAVGVPLYLWHGGSPQGTSPSPTTTSGNNNNNNGNTAGTTNPTTNTNNNGQNTNPNTGSNTGDNNGSGGNSNGGSGGSTSNSCSEHKSHDSDNSGSSSNVKANDNGNGKDNSKQNGNAFGRLAKQMDTTVALVKSMGTHNSALHQNHDTKTDNDTVHDPSGASHNSSDPDSSCASAEESNEQD